MNLSRKEKYFALLILSLLFIARASAGEFKVVVNNDGLLVLDGQDSVIFYQKAPKSLDGRYERANYLHPLWGLDGTVLTEDFPPDHRHHRGIFWAWHQVYVGDKRMGDGWSTDEFQWNVEEVKVLRLDSLCILRAHVYWQSPLLLDERGQPQPFVEEITDIAVSPVLDGKMRFIDFTIRLRALKERVRIGGSENKKGYGGFSVRLRLPKDLTFISEYKEITPITNQIQAGPWMDFSGTFSDEHKSGVAIFCHPSVPGFPQPWILRRKGSMQNAVYPGTEPVLLPQEKPLVFRYRLVLHKGDASSLDLNRLYNEYSEE